MGKIERRRRVITVCILAFFALGGALYTNLHKPTATQDNNATTTQSQSVSSSPAVAALGKLAVKGRAPKTGYTREQFGGQWASEGLCTMRDKILARDMAAITYKANTCEVATGTLNDPYTGKVIQFVRGPSTSSLIQIDHVVAISNAWQTGAQQISLQLRQQLYNDPLELLAVDGPANNQKGDGDAATWLPPNKAYRCRYVARQIAVKLKYSLWVTPAEHDAIARVLGSCPDQVLPVAS